MSDRYMMATKAMHPLGDIFRAEPDICIIYGEELDNWVGEWVTGLGYINVRFPKETTRNLTEEEAAYFDGKLVQIGSHIPMPLKVR